MLAALLKLLLLVIAALLLWQLAAQWRQSRGRAARRAAFLDPCKTLFTSGTKTIAETGFPRMAGTYEGHAFDLQVVPDTLNFRKLPVLWLLVTLTEPQPVKGTLDIMLRPRGIEPFSNFSNLPVQIDIPSGFPEDCAVRCDDPATMPPVDVVRRHLALITQGAGKELVISPKGLRAVAMADEAQRSSYLLFRDSEMGLEPVQSEMIARLLDGLLALGEDLKDQPA